LVGISGHVAGIPPVTFAGLAVTFPESPVTLDRNTHWHMQVRARLGKGSVRHLTNHRRVAANTGMKIGEKGIEKGLLGARTHRQQRCDERWQRQLALSGKGFGETWMPCPLGKRVRGNQIGEIQQELLDKITVLRSP
jgi:hypothetical protein